MSKCLKNWGKTGVLSLHITVIPEELGATPVFCQTLLEQIRVISGIRKKPQLPMGFLTASKQGSPGKGCGSLWIDPGGFPFPSPAGNDSSEF